MANIIKTQIPRKYNADQQARCDIELAEEFSTFGIQLRTRRFVQNWPEFAANAVL